MRQDEVAEFYLKEDEFDAMLAEGTPAEVSGPAEAIRRINDTPPVGGDTFVGDGFEVDGRSPPL